MHRLFFEVTFILFSEKKSDDPQHPAYVPTIFNFTSSPKKRRIELSLRRHQRASKNEAQKRHHQLLHSAESEEAAEVNMEQGMLLWMQFLGIQHPLCENVAL